MWHGECQHRYTLRKSCELTEKKRLLEEATCILRPKTMKKVTLINLNIQLDYKGKLLIIWLCIICEQCFTKYKKASLAMTQSSGSTLVRKAQELDDRDIIDKV